MCDSIALIGLNTRGCRSDTHRFQHGPHTCVLPGEKKSVIGLFAPEREREFHHRRICARHALTHARTYAREIKTAGKAYMEEMILTHAPTSSPASGPSSDEKEHFDLLPPLWRVVTFETSQSTATHRSPSVFQIPFSLASDLNPVAKTHVAN